jgi:hypothetical protein
MKNNRLSQTLSYIIPASPPKLLAVLILLLSFFKLSAQPQDYFYRAWTQTGGTVSPGFINRVVAVAGSGGITYTATSVLISSNNYGLRLTRSTSGGSTSWIANFNLGLGAAPMWVGWRSTPRATSS